MYDVPVDLKQYGWSETLVNYTKDEDIQAVIANNPVSLKVFSSVLEARDEMLQEEYNKVQQSYNIKNIPNIKHEITSDFGSHLFSGLKWLLYGGLVAGGFTLGWFLKGGSK